MPLLLSFHPLGSPIHKPYRHLSTPLHPLRLALRFLSSWGVRARHSNYSLEKASHSLPFSHLGLTWENLNFVKTQFFPYPKPALKWLNRKSFKHNDWPHLKQQSTSLTQTQPWPAILPLVDELPECPLLRSIPGYLSLCHLLSLPSSVSLCTTIWFYSLHNYWLSEVILFPCLSSLFSQMRSCSEARTLFTTQSLRGRATPGSLWLAVSIFKKGHVRNSHPHSTGMIFKQVNLLQPPDSHGRIKNPSQDCADVTQRKR